MSTSRQEIRSWLVDAKALGMTHCIIVCDTYDHSDYPVYVKPGQDPHQIYRNYNGVDMQRVMEVYNLSMDLEKQLNEHRSFNF